MPVALEARRSLPGLRVRPQPGDLIAGLSVALILIPQSLALADLAGLPAYHGLYAAVLPLLVAAFFVSSPYLQTGPVAITSLLTFGALSSMALAKSPDFVALAALLAIVVGLARVGLGLARAGFLAHFMSHAVLVGFTTGAAILIIASQLPTALGAQPPAGKLLVQAWWALAHPGSWELASIALGGLTIVLVLGGRRLHALFPGVLVAVAIGLAFSLLTGYTGPSVGAIPSGLPPFTLDLPWRALPALLVPGGVIALVGFAEPAAIARTFAAQDRQRWSPDREFISQGMANLAAGVSGGFPVGGSFGRSFVTRLAGGKTRWSGAITGLLAVFQATSADRLADLRGDARVGTADRLCCPLRDRAFGGRPSLARAADHGAGSLRERDPDAGADGRAFLRLRSAPRRCPDRAARSAPGGKPIGHRPQAAGTHRLYGSPRHQERRG